MMKRVKVILKCLGASAILTFILVIAVVVLAAGWLLLSHESLINRSSAIETTREWPRLDELPLSTYDLDIDITGTMFTRGFILPFRGWSDEIESWLQSSTGTKRLIPFRCHAGRRQ